MDWPERWELIKNSTAQALEPLGGALMDGATKALEVLSEKLGEIDPAVFEDMGVLLGDVLSGAIEVLSGALEFLVDHKEQIGAFFKGIKDGIQLVIDFTGPLVTAFFNVARKLPQYISDAKARLSAIWDGIKSTISGAVDAISSKVSSTFEGIKSTVSGIWEGVKSAIEGPMNAARDAVSSAIESIKGLFNFQFSWPHIPLPHFSISGSANPLDWIKNGTPKISVEWYAQGGIVDEPTVLSVAGERGAELVWPSYEPYLTRYADALVERMDKGGRRDANGVVVTGNTFIVRRESDIPAIGRAINDEARRREWSRL